MTARKDDDYDDDDDNSDDGDKRQGRMSFSFCG